MIKFFNFFKVLIIAGVISVGSFFVWSKYGNNNKPVKIDIATFITQKECEQVAQKQCSYDMCDNKCPPGYREGWRATDKELVKTIVSVVENGAEKVVEPIINKTENKKPAVLPDKMVISVPFTTQAPYANWDERHEEACEEASLLMLKYYLDGKKLNKEIAEKEIQALIDFQIKTYGDYRDSNAQGIVQLAEDYYGLKNLEVVYDFSQEDIVQELANGKPIIVLAAGRLLGNPNFTAPGPLYHALVLVGYNGNTIITNDPGTRKGEGYQYDIAVLYAAIHDFPGNLENIEQGRKAMIIFDK